MLWGHLMVEEEAVESVWSASLRVMSQVLTGCPVKTVEVVMVVVGVVVGSRWVVVGVVASHSLPMLLCGSHHPFLCIRDVVIFLSLYLRFVFASLRNHYRPIDLTVELNGAV